MEGFYQGCIFMSLEDPSGSQVKNEQWSRVDSQRDDAGWGLGGSNRGGGRSDWTHILEVGQKTS